MKLFRGRKKNVSLWVLTLAITILLSWISLYAFHFSSLIQPEKSIVKKSFRIKRYLNEYIFPNCFYDKEFVKDNFVLVNTTCDAALASESGNGTSCVTSITDRRKLAMLFKWLSENPGMYKAVVCDILFTTPSQNPADDDTLKYYTTKLLRNAGSKMVFASQFDHEQGKPVPGLLDSITRNENVTGSIDYAKIVDGEFLEFSLASEHNKVKSLPLLMYEKAYNAQTSDGRILGIGDQDGTLGMLKIKGPQQKAKRVWTNVVPEIFFTSEDILAINTFESSGGDTGAVRLELGTAMEDGGLNMQVLCGNSQQKIIFIGSFGKETLDQHVTMYGSTNGSVILLNIFYGLASGKNKVDFPFLFFLLTSLFFISMDIVFHNSLKKHFFNIVYFGFFFFLVKLLLQGLGTVSLVFKPAAEDFKKWGSAKAHYFVLFLFAIISNLLFGKVVNIIVLELAIFFFHLVFGYLDHKPATAKRRHT